MRRCIALLAGAAIVRVVATPADMGGNFNGSPEHPAIEYYTRPVNDAVSALNRQIQDGKLELRFDRVNGYLRSVLDALHIQTESQMMVFSKTSLQKPLISSRNPRSIFFNDSVAVAWVRGEPFVEVATQDSRQGVIFYTLNQDLADKPLFQRRDDCLSCHLSYSSLGVPGMLVRSVYTEPGGQTRRELGDYITDHRSPMQERFGGWYVTGNFTGVRHMGNAMVIGFSEPGSMITAETLNLKSLDGKFDPYAYLSSHSDIAALMVFDHQMHMTNLLTRMGWEVRLALHEQGHDLPKVLDDTARAVVDYLLFIDEPPFAGKVEGTSGFAQKFAAGALNDKKGRSLRQLDLNRRLMRYPCSYMIYTEAFDGLPAEAIGAIYKRMWRILSGMETGEKYARLSSDDRKAIVEILRDTKKGLPGYFRVAR